MLMRILGVLFQMGYLKLFPENSPEEWMEHEKYPGERYKTLVRFLAFIFSGPAIILLIGAFFYWIGGNITTGELSMLRYNKGGQLAFWGFLLFAVVPCLRIWVLHRYFPEVDE
jgi:hypothetical protein